MRNQTMIQDLEDRVNAGEEGAFAIARRDEGRDLILITRRRAFPVVLAQLELKTDTQRVVLTEADWNGELMVDDKGDASAKARIAFAGKDLLLDSETDSFTGALTVLAVPGSDKSKVLVLDAAFFCTGEEPQSSLLWDTSPEMVHHWHTGLLRRRRNELVP